VSGQPGKSGGRRQGAGALVAQITNALLQRSHSAPALPLLSDTHRRHAPVTAGLAGSQDFGTFQN
jgi:hypothetical protein